MTEPEYLPQPHWVPLRNGKGWVGVPTTPADDFPPVDEPDLEDLI